MQWRGWSTYSDIVAVWSWLDTEQLMMNFGTETIKVCVYICLYLCVCLCVCVYLFVCMCVLARTIACVTEHVHAYVCAGECICKCAGMCVFLCGDVSALMGVCSIICVYVFEIADRSCLVAKCYSKPCQYVTMYDMHKCDIQLSTIVPYYHKFISFYTSIIGTHNFIYSLL